MTPEMQLAQALGGIDEKEKKAYTLAELHGAATAVGAGAGGLRGAMKPGKDGKGKTKSRVKGALKGAAKGALVANLAAPAIPLAQMTMAHRGAVGKAAKDIAEVYGKVAFNTGDRIRHSIKRVLSKEKKAFDRRDIAGHAIKGIAGGTAAALTGAAINHVIKKRKAKKQAAIQAADAAGRHLAQAKTKEANLMMGQALRTMARTSVAKKALVGAAGGAVLNGARAAVSNDPNASVVGSALTGAAGGAALAGGAHLGQKALLSSKGAWGQQARGAMRQANVAARAAPAAAPAAGAAQRALPAAAPQKALPAKGGAPAPAPTPMAARVMTGTAPGAAPDPKALASAVKKAKQAPGDMAAEVARRTDAAKGTSVTPSPIPGPKPQSYVDARQTRMQAMRGRVARAMGMGQA
jgi:hypothetical protein